MTQDEVKMLLGAVYATVKSAKGDRVGWRYDLEK